MKPFKKPLSIVAFSICAAGFGADAVQSHQFGSFFANASHLIVGRKGAPPLMYAIPEKIEAAAEPWATTRIEPCIQDEAQTQVPLAEGYRLKITARTCVVTNAPDGAEGKRITLFPVVDWREDGKDLERRDSMSDILAKIQGPRPDGKKYAQIDIFAAALHSTPADLSLADEGVVGQAKMMLLKQKKYLLRNFGNSHWVEYHVEKLHVLEGEVANHPDQHIAYFGNDGDSVFMAQYNLSGAAFRGFLAALDNPVLSGGVSASAAGSAVSAPATAPAAPGRQPASPLIQESGRH